MIELYTGEFLISPVPLQMSFNWCSHACTYCFANLNKPGRKAKVRELQSQLKNYHKQNNLVAHLLRERYPVLISNLVDPFATSNYQIAVPAMEQLTDLGVPVCIQTRGGRGIDDALSFLPPSMWYISVPTLDDEVRKRIEPAAPTIQSRLDLIERLLSMGHKVTVGSNPMDWIGDPEEYVTTMKALGVDHLWSGMLHFSHEQVRNMPTWAKDALTPELLKAITGKRTHPPEQVEQLIALVGAMNAHGVSWFSTECLFTTDFFDSYNEVYPKAFPTVSQFLARQRDAHTADFDMTLADFDAYALPLLPEGIHHMPGYLFNRDRNVYDKNPSLPKKMDFRELLGIMWNNPKFSGINYFGETGSLIEYDPDLPGEVRYSTDERGNLRYRYMFKGNALEYAMSIRST